MEWDAAKKMADQMGGRFIRLADKGDKVFGVIVGKPEFRKTYFNEKTGKTEDWTAEHEKAGYTAGGKFVSNLLELSKEKGSGQAAVKVYEMNATSFKSVCKGREKYGSTKVFEIERQGAKGDTKTYNTYLPERDATNEEIAIIKALDEKGEHAEMKLKLHDLLHLRDDDTEDASGQTDLSSHDKKTAGAAQSAPAATASSTIPKEEILAIGSRLKALPDANAKIRKFLDDFGVKQLKDLPGTRLVEVREYVDRLEGKTGNGAPAAENDPFATA